MKLLVDIGNTRAKWAVLADGRLDAPGAVVHRGRPAAEWTAALDAIEGPFEAILVANVAGPTAVHALGEWSLRRHGARPQFQRSGRAAAGIENSYDHPETLGVDRWLGMIGAWGRVQAPLVCITAGTALTIDAVDAGGHHLGGLIVPGYDLMVEALLHRTSEIAPGVAVAAPSSAGIFGRNTAAAVDRGACHALAAVAERAVRSVAGGGALPHVFLGGGDAGRIAGLIDLPHERAPDLVLEGLAILAGAGA